MARGLGQLRRAFYAAPSDAALTALEDFIRRAEERQRSRAGVVGRNRRRMTRSNLKYARRPEGWREWLSALVKRRLPRHKSVVIPVHLRPGVPWVDAALGYQEQRTAILAEARKRLPRHQYEKVYPRWVAEKTPAAERKAAKVARVAQRRAWWAEMDAAPLA